jgi:nucleoside-diphosphate-sugar epimerase
VQIAVLGAGGFVGSRLMEQAALTPQWQFVPVLRSPKNLARLSKLGIAARFADTSRVDSLASALDGHEVVINMAAGDWTSIRSDAAIAYEASARAGVRLLIHLSSAVVFGRVLSPDIHDDSAPELDSWMLYAREKGQAEVFLRARMAAGGPGIVVLRPGLIWGPRSPWCALPARQLAMGAAWLGGSGRGVCNLVHVDNLLRYVSQVLPSAGRVSGFYNVADPDTVTWQAFYDAIALGLGYPLSRIHTTEAGPRVASPGALLERLKQWPPFYRVMKGLLKGLSAEAKSRLKYYLPALAGGGFEAPCPVDAPVVESAPRLTREQWALHNTRHRLPTAKFVRDFGDPRLMSFEEGLAATLAWLRFAGYGAQTFFT